MASERFELALMLLFAIGMVASLFAVMSFAFGGYVGQPVDSATYGGAVESVEEDKGLVFEKDQVTVVHGDDADARASFCVLGADADEQLESFRQAASGGHSVSVEYYSPYWVSPTDCAGSTGGTIKIVTDVTVSGGEAA